MAKLLCKENWVLQREASNHLLTETKDYLAPDTIGPVARATNSHPEADMLEASRDGGFRDLGVCV